MQRAHKPFLMYLLNIIGWAALEGPFKDYLIQPSGLPIHPALLKFIGFCEDMGTKISATLLW